MGLSLSRESTDRTKRGHDDNQVSVVPIFCPEPTSFFSVVSVWSGRLSWPAIRAGGGGK